MFLADRMPTECSIDMMTDINQSISQFIEKHKQYNSKLLKCDIMGTMCFKGQKGHDGTNNCPEKE